MAYTGGIYIDWQTNVAGIASDIKKIEGHFTGFQRKMGSIASGIAGAFAGMISIGTLTALAKSSLELGDNLMKASEKFGISVENLSALKFAAEMADVPFESLGISIKKFSTAIAEGVTPTSEMGIAFNAMGIKLKDANGIVKDTDKLLVEVARKFATYRDGAEKTALAVSLWGRAGMDMLPVLKDMAKGFDSMRAEADRFNALFSRDAAEKLEYYNDRLKQLKIQATGWVTKFIVDLDDAYRRMYLLQNQLNKPIITGKLKDILVPPPPSESAPNVKAIEDANKKREKIQEQGAKNAMRLLQEYADGLALFYGDAAEMANILADEEIKAFEIRSAANKKFEEGQVALIRDNFLALTKDFGDQTDTMLTSAELLEIRWKEFDEAITKGNVRDAIFLLTTGLAGISLKTEEASDAARLFQEAWKVANTTVIGYLNQLAAAGLSAMRMLEDSIVNAVMTGKMKWREFANSVLAEITRIAVRMAIIQPLMGAFMGFISPAVGGGGTTNLNVGSIKPIAFGGGAQHGGPVSGGTAYLVGERGPELFVPKSGGTVVPSAAQNVKVEIVNQSGQPMQVTQAKSTVDPQEMVVTLWLDALQRNRFGLRTAMGAG